MILYSDSLYSNIIDSVLQHIPMTRAAFKGETQSPYFHGLLYQTSFAIAIDCRQPLQNESGSHRFFTRLDRDLGHDVEYPTMACLWEAVVYQDEFIKED